ncbi:MAG TPA: hypothetical protein VKA30_01210, partial [Actinomycetota bacterium]|nr:hypothetical protein [Actinomycetota bacterium]
MRGKAPMARPFVLAVFLVLAAGQASALAGSPEDLVGLPAWDRVPTPNGSGSSGELHGVQAFSATNVWVVGHTGTSTLTERWNGSSFSVVPSPSIANRSSILEDVDGVAPNDLWTVGHADVTSFVGSRSLALHWNGSSWTRIATPSVGKSTAFNDLTGVAAVASNDVWAVGTFQGGTGGNTFHALIQHWNGTAWSLVRNDCGRGLNKVDARSATDIWAVGGSDTCHWNGSSWTRFPVGPPPNQQGFVNLSDVTVIGATNAWAVGDQATSCGEGQ